jgi:hypothetical protein
VGSGAPQPWPNQDRWTGGVVFIDPRFATNLGVVLHEVGHGAGLGHVPNPDEVMYRDPRDKTHYMPGDAAGLLTLSLQCQVTFCRFRCSRSANPRLNPLRGQPAYRSENANGLRPLNAKGRRTLTTVSELTIASRPAGRGAGRVTS